MLDLCTVARRPVLARVLGAFIAAVLSSAAVTWVTASPAIADASCTGPSVSLAVMSTVSQSGCWRPFTANSPLNTELPTNPKLTDDNSAVQQHMATYGWTFGDSSTGFSFNESDGTRPVYFAQPSDPTMTINCTNEEGPNTCQGDNAININGARINVPAGAQPGHNWDAHMIIVETNTGQEYDLWHASISGSTITAGTGSVENINTTNGTAAAGDAANFALTAGLLRPSELASGQIDHALVIDIPCTNAHGPTVGYSWPATGGWGETCGSYWNESPTGAPAIGQLFKLNMTAAEIASSGAPAWEQTIMTTLAHYGAYAEDTNGSWHSEGISILSQDPISWTSLGQTDQWTSVINQLGGHNGTLSSSIPIPTSKLQTIDPCVQQGTCPNATGPGLASGVTPAPPTAVVARVAPTRGRTTHMHHSRRVRRAGHAKVTRNRKVHRGAHHHPRRPRHHGKRHGKRHHRRG